MKLLRSASASLLGAFSSVTMAALLICTLALLTFLGTLAQVEFGLYEVQRKYFESIFLTYQLGPIGVPLPGGALVMGLLFVNLSLGGVLRIRRGLGTLGVATAHIGMLGMLGAGFVKFLTGVEGQVTLYEGDRASHFASYTETELAIVEVADNGDHREQVVAADLLEDARPDRPTVVGGLPFRLEITHWFANADVLPKGPMFDVQVPVVDGLFLRGRPRDSQVERNGQAAYVRVTSPGGTPQVGMLWAYDAAPWTLEVDGRRFALDLRRTRHAMPFSVQLDTFTKKNHPGTNMPAWFSSDVQVAQNGVTRPVTISMNQPLREQGLVLYQASWGPSSARPGDPLFSTLAVVHNPADQWPLYSCLVIAAGLIFHFGRKLNGHMRREMTR